MRIVIFGANGPTGRLLGAQCTAAGHDTVAVTRSPDTFPLRQDRVRVVAGDVLDRDTVNRVVEGSDAVLSALGVPFGKAPVETYSRGAANMLSAMRRFDVRRLVVLSSGAVTGEDEPTGGFVFNRVLQPFVMKRLGKTVYDDMRRMEEMVSSSPSDWTILRPSGLYELAEVTDYSTIIETTTASAAPYQAHWIWLIMKLDCGQATVPVPWPIQSRPISSATTPRIKSRWRMRFPRLL